MSRHSIPNLPNPKLEYNKQHFTSTRTQPTPLPCMCLLLKDTVYTPIKNSHKLHNSPLTADVVSQDMSPDFYFFKANVANKH